MEIDWNTLLVNAVGGIATSLPIVFAFWMSMRGGHAEAAERAGKSLNDLWTRYDVLDKLYTAMDKRLSITLVYMVELIESHRRHNIMPPPPPEELKSDPDIIRLFETYRKRNKQRNERRKL